MKFRNGNVSLKRKPKTSFEQYQRQVSQRPAQPRRSPMRRPVKKVKSKDEDELDKSLKEAEKLLKGKWRKNKWKWGGNF